MIKIFSLFLLSLFYVNLCRAQKTPSSRSGVETGIDFRALKKYKRYLFLVETKNRQELADTDYHQLMVGSYYRITKRFRTGLFFLNEQGLLWDNDWHKENTVWQWSNSSRWDFSTVLDTTYTNNLGRNWVWEIKGRLFYYHSRQALLLRPRPAIRHFILKLGQPWWQIYAEAEAYLPLNYGNKSLYEYWLYLGGLHQFTPNFSLGPVVSYRTRWFHPYKSFKAVTGQDYNATFKSVYFGLSAVYAW